MKSEEELKRSGGGEGGILLGPDVQKSFFFFRLNEKLSVPGGTCNVELIFYLVNM
jgi:hypothetical protein